MPITRRKLLVSGAAGTLAIAAANVMPTVSRAQGAKDTIKVALAARSSGGMNPQILAVNGADNWVISQMFNTLVKRPDGGWALKPEDVQPSLAESWTTSGDGKTWTYRLRRGVKFHKNYGDVSADDVVFTIGRHLDPKINTNSKTYYRGIASVEAADPLTVVFKLKQPDPFFNTTVLSHLTASIQSRRAFEEKGEGINTDPIGTGPYQFKSIDTAKGAILTAFPEHFDGPPVTPNLQILYIADTTARTLAFASGDVDMIEGVRAPGWIETMRQQSSGTEFDATAPGSFNILSFNLEKKPLSDIKVRQAIRHAIDTSAIAGAFGSVATPMLGLIPSQFPGAVKQQDLPENIYYKYDPEKSKALLAEAGFKDGLTIPCYISQREDYASIMLMIQEQLRAVNINLDMKIIDHATYHSDNRRDKNTLILSSTSYPPLPTAPIAELLSKVANVKPDGTGISNYSHYGVAISGIDDMLDKAMEEPDINKRIALVSDIEKKILTDLPACGVISLSYLVARNPRLDIGFKVQSGPAYWPLNRAKLT
ncbi:ABC transporter substrate-binding protein (plasmid) [Agrobacterium leguminum]|uniref:Extracellular solute-binding protein, family 5 n=1 Tax=Agrobacterium deltaense NCPPB 1641 TaxID=1183425 RepID=A0A1S7U919_9HYPH|nr:MULTISPECIES: ABC transporter substrate-binding protein [Agrobacterium]WFS70074.1 ABC transporter substrate-binding protein [Agrobacterium leguminum]CVI63436.1 Extracellular solute-binding protein, family 5 [Agrobacterium deltaense NCPPB 1641]